MNGCERRREILAKSKIFLQTLGLCASYAMLMRPKMARNSCPWLLAIRLTIFYGILQAYNPLPKWLHVSYYHVYAIYTWVHLYSHIPISIVLLPLLLSLYIDDSIIVGNTFYNECALNVIDNVKIRDNLNFVPQPKTSVFIPTQKIVYLGFVLK